MLLGTWGLLGGQAPLGIWQAVLQAGGKATRSCCAPVSCKWAGPRDITRARKLPQILPQARAVSVSEPQEKSPRKDPKVPPAGGALSQPCIHPDRRIPLCWKEGVLPCSFSINS